VGRLAIDGWTPQPPRFARSLVRGAPRCPPLAPPGGSRSTLRCRRSASLAANRSMAKACARPAGQNSPSSQNPIARGSGLPSSTIRDRNCSRCRRSPIRRPMIAAAPRCAMTISRTLVHALKYQDRTDLAPAMGGWMARPRGTARQRRHADSSTAALAAGFRPPLQRARSARARLHARSAWPWRVWCCAGCAGPNSNSGFARTAREQCAGRISGIRWPPGRRRGTARRLVDDVLTLGGDSGCLRASTFAGEGGPCRHAGLRPGCGWPPLSHILRYNPRFPRQTCP
jgi:hypothetical protein